MKPLPPVQNPRQVNTIEFAVVEREVFDRLKRGGEVLKKINAEMKLEDVEKMLEETEEAVAYQRVCEKPRRGS